jgi:hypothetical protein
MSEGQYQGPQYEAKWIHLSPQLVPLIWGMFLPFYFYHTQKYLNKTPKLVTCKERSPRTKTQILRLVKKH